MSKGKIRENRRLAARLDKLFAWVRRMEPLLSQPPDAEPQTARLPRLYAWIGAFAAAVFGTIWLLLTLRDGLSPLWVNLLYGVFILSGLWLILAQKLWRIDVYPSRGLFRLRTAYGRVYTVPFADCLYFEHRLPPNVICLKTKRKTLWLDPFTIRLDVLLTHIPSKSDLSRYRKRATLRYSRFEAAVYGVCAAVWGGLTVWAWLSDKGRDLVLLLLFLAAFVFCLALFWSALCFSVEADKANEEFKWRDRFGLRHTARYAEVAWYRKHKHVLYVRAKRHTIHIPLRLQDADTFLGILRSKGVEPKKTAS